MNPIKYQIDSFNENYDILKNIRGEVHRVPLFIDYIWCLLKYGASAADYFEYEFYNKKHSLKKEFVCWKYKTKFFHQMNDYSKSYIFNDKVEFLRNFCEYVGRDWLDMKNCSYTEFECFVNKHSEFIAKPQNLSCGRGVRRVVCTSTVNELFEGLKSEECLIEEIIIQHDQMKQLNDSSVNTVRIGTVQIGNEIRILGATLRCGISGETIDNLCAGGLAAKVDPETGVVISDGVNIMHERHYRHPSSGLCFHGFKIPNWDKALQIVINAAKEIPGVKYTGWDVAFRENDVVLVEGNFEGMMNIFQMPTGEGIKGKIDNILKEIEIVNREVLHHEF